MEQHNSSSSDSWTDRLSPPPLPPLLKSIALSLPPPPPYLD